MAYESYDNTKSKLRKLWEKAEKQKLDTSRLKDKFTFNKTHLTKPFTKIVITENNIDADWEGQFYLEGMPEWMLPMILPVAYFKSTGDGIDLQNVEIFGGYFKYIFYKVGKNKYLFKYRADISLDTDEPYYPNIYLYVYNQRNYEHVKKDKGSSNG